MKEINEEREENGKKPFDGPKPHSNRKMDEYLWRINIWDDTRSV